ncbi:AlbA family DNA-binding domain-containing protein [Nesterenkonia haasae]|uniref:AlbA family DNA-binding domain-containing protein n=1 Tax=Nesterenkonia haasae TaxID=2587813 RepID=UPI001391EA03|nr:ATP-binding protein [Nesterenkonia haasae]NDK32445.1 ATP-binding protein [Nesterenkonia haasae]
MLTNEELAALVATGAEQRSIEFKSTGSTNTESFVATVARACIALANQRDGGHVVIGVADNDPGGHSGGIDPQHLREWLSYDTVMQKINVYADPPLTLRLEERHLPSGAAVIVIEVAEFDQVPILSNRDYGKRSSGATCTRDPWLSPRVLAQTRRTNCERFFN